ncbi:hypothetical protein ASH02_12390 [Nocardioides sp. Soil796]|nr:hypothetical protein ASH02_12390 [Nocardioides sp. Soil796]
MRRISGSASMEGMTTRLLAGAAAAFLLLAATGCTTDTPLGTEVTDTAVAPGDAVKGRVIYPDGKIRVTIVSASSPVVKDHKYAGHRDQGEQACSYDDEKFSCPTDGLTDGLYVVQVIDEGVPSEGTSTAMVSVTSIADYQPTWQADGDVVRLSGWGADRTVKALIRTENGKEVIARTLRTDGSGSARLSVATLKKARYEISLDDGLWHLGNIDYPFNVLDRTE